MVTVQYARMDRNSYKNLLCALLEHGASASTNKEHNMARNFTATSEKQASALLAQGGADEDTVRELLPVVASTYREHSDMNVKSAVQFVLDAITAPVPSSVNATSAPTAKKAASKKTASKQAEAASKARAPRRNARDIMLLAALENGWKVTEHRDSEGRIIKGHEEQDENIRMLHPNRGRRDWSATARQGKATLYLSTVRNPNGSIHPDGCWLFQDGKTVNVAYLYEIVSVLSTPLTKDGFAVPPTDKETAKASYASTIGTLTSAQKEASKAAPAKKSSTKKSPAKASA